MDMYFKSPGAKFVKDRKPWRPDTKMFDYYAEKIAAERQERFLELKKEVSGYLYLKDIRPIELGTSLPLPEKFKTDIVMLRPGEIREMRRFLILRINKDFADFVGNLGQLGLVVKVSGRTFYCVKNCWFVDEDLRKLSQNKVLTEEQYGEMKKGLKSAEGVEGKVDYEASGGRNLPEIKRAFKEWRWYYQKHASLAYAMSKRDEDEGRQDGHYYVGWLVKNFGLVLNRISNWIFYKE